jgi:hypothetical protein
MTTTLVTCFYEIRSKFPKERYMRWASEYMRLQAPIVLFTSADLAPLFKHMRGDLPIHIVVRPFEELDSWLLYKDLWIMHHEKDCEAQIHSPELYALWANKAFFVKEAVKENPFKTNHFFWCDIGAFREPIVDQNILDHFPLASRFPVDRILISSVAPLRTGETDFEHVDRIVGGLWGGTGEACLRWLAAYESMLLLYKQRGKFAGKDQSVMLSAYLANPTVATIVKPNIQMNIWFYLTRLLSDISVPFEPDPSYVMEHLEKPSVSVRIMGGLGNQLFQIATAYAYARKHNYRLVLPLKKQEEDRRSLYWDTLLYRFKHILQEHVNYPVLYEKIHHVYSEFPAIPNIKLEGYFQSLLYFKNYLPELRDLFAPSGFVVRNIQLKYEELLSQKDRVVVVHARRGDYLTSAWNISVHGPLSVTYYFNSMELMKTYVSDPIYLLCSDEPMYWIENMAALPELQTHQFHILNDEDDIHTLALLSQFKHFIVANSTFSLWAATLAHAKHVIAPKQWYGPRGPAYFAELFDPSWILIHQ